MMTLAKMMMIMMMVMMSQNLNPVKMSMLIMILSSVSFYLLNQMSGSSWFPNIFFLLFMGGILIMFMILSSILPNEKSMKMNKTMIVMYLILSFLTMNILGFFNTQSTTQMKWFMQSNMSMQMMTLLIMGYFLSFIMMISKENIPMRSSLCYKKNKLVNY